MKILLYGIAVMALMATFVACEKNELDVNVPETAKESTNETNILSFANEAEFQALIEKIRNNETIPSSKLRSASTESSEFVSLFDEYDEAMSVADEYYTREGGYEEFKERFPNLYYPEHGEDYAAFLPVSDEAIAKLLNKEGKVIICGEEKDMRDVSSYEKIQELGLGMPNVENISTTRFTGLKPVIDPSFPYNVILTTSKEIINSRRMMWVTLRGIEKDVFNLPYAKVKDARVDFCWRKKGTLGWYNGKLYGYPTIIILNKMRYPLDKKYEYSPMKFTVMREFSAKIKDFPSNSPLDIYVRFESKETYADFTAVYPANLKQILELNNGDGFWETFSGLLKKAIGEYGSKYGSYYLTEFWNNIND